jgi:hypothetical protein
MNLLATKIMSLKTNKILRIQILPIVILLLWLIIVGVFIWQRVCESQQSPLNDALSYIQKAKSFWENVSQGWKENPLDLVQPVRPPGTVLLSYPFGFTSDYHGFLFRTVFVPFVIWVISLLIILIPTNNKKGGVSYWPVLFAIFLLGPIPFFFQFEIPTQAYWGMMDGFLASLAALAVASAIRSLTQKSIIWAVISAFFATFCILVKPSGSLVLLLTTMFWSGGAFIRFFNSDLELRFKALWFCLLGTTIYIVLGGIISLMCLHSKYLSPEVVSYYKQAVLILQNESDKPLTLQFILSTIISLFGPQFFITVFIMLLIYRVRSSKLKIQIPDWVFLAASLLFILVGGWFWVFASGVDQLRYFYPFALMFVVPLIFISFRKLVAIEHLIPRFLLWSLCIISILPALNLVLLLSEKNPNARWQNISGVSMNVRSNGAGVAIAKNLLKEINISNESPLVYSISYSSEIISFSCYGWYHNLINPELPFFSTKIPIDWQRPSTYRISEIIEADYIIFKPLTDSEQDLVFQMKEINSLGDEGRIFDAFLSSLGPGNGLITKFENQECRLSKITNKEKLKEAFDIFVKSKSWRPVFIKENEIASAKALKSVSRKVDLKFREPKRKINFYFDRIDASKSSIKIIGWGFLEGLNSDSLNTYVLFKKGQEIIVYNTVLQIRKDLTTGFIKTGLNLDSAGFQLKIPTGNFDNGQYQLGLYIEKGNNSGLLFSDKFVNVEN